MGGIDLPVERSMDMKAERRMTYKQWKRLFIKEVIEWTLLGMGVAGFFLTLFYYWVVYGYAF